MNKKNVDYILSSTDGIELLANLFQNGMALDLVDVTRARDNVDLPEDERHIYDMADAALDRVDLDKLYENAGDFELQDKYPDSLIICRACSVTGRTMNLNVSVKMRLAKPRKK